MSAEPSPRWKLAFNDQVQSSFLSKLPWDIRRMIYDLLLHDLSGIQHVFPGSEYYVGCHIKCELTSKPNEDNFGILLQGNSSHAACYKLTPMVRRRGNAARSYRPLLVICQRMYSEAAGIIYSSAYFSLSSLQEMDYFLSSFSPRSLDTIKFLHLSWYLWAPVYWEKNDQHPFHNAQAWESIEIHRAENEVAQWEKIGRMIKTMKGLAKLRVNFVNVPFLVPERELLRPLLGSHVEDILVEFKWRRGYRERVSAPFDIDTPVFAGPGFGPPTMEDSILSEKKIRKEARTLYGSQHLIKCYQFMKNHFRVLIARMRDK